MFNKHYVYGNELYAELTPHGYGVIDSRVWKKEEIRNTTCTRIH